MSVRGVLFWLNVIGLLALVAYLAWGVLSPRRTRAEGEPTPPNQTPFLPDEDLENRRLERVLGWSLLFGGIIAVALPLYWLREPTRQDESVEYFETNAVDRGEVLFAGPQSEAFDSVESLQCANCHGGDGGGGSASAVIDPDGEGGDPPVRLAWKAPPLNTVLLRFSEEEVERVITFGRPGTPMQAFGLAGGGAENTQTIRDLIAYLRSIQLSPEEARARTVADLAAARTSAGEQLRAAEEAFASAQETLDAAGETLRAALNAPTADDANLTATCDDLETLLETQPEAVDADQRAACRDYLRARSGLEQAQRRLEWAQEWNARREGVGDGQLLFELNCARCHTEGWSVFDAADPDTVRFLGPAGGGGGQGGGIGFNLRDGATIRRFGAGIEPGDPGFDAHADFVGEGSDENAPYGNAGIGSGKMPGFGQMLTREQIEAIVEYERTGLEQTTFTSEDDGA